MSFAVLMLLQLAGHWHEKNHTILASCNHLQQRRAPQKHKDFDGLALAADSQQLAARLTHCAGACTAAASPPSPPSNPFSSPQTATTNAPQPLLAHSVH
jgi:hypothetical protein